MKKKKKRNINRNICAFSSQLIPIYNKNKKVLKQINQKILIG